MARAISKKKRERACSCVRAPATSEARNAYRDRLTAWRTPSCCGAPAGGRGVIPMGVCARPLVGCAASKTVSNIWGFRVSRLSARIYDVRRQWTLIRGAGVSRKNTGGIPWVCGELPGPFLRMACASLRFQNVRLTFEITPGIYRRFARGRRELRGGRPSPALIGFVGHMPVSTRRAHGRLSASAPRWRRGARERSCFLSR